MSIVPSSETTTARHDNQIIERRNVLFVISAGVAGCLYMRLNFLLSNTIPSAVFFPVMNGSIVMLSAIAGKLLFNEEINKVQMLGFALAIIGLIINGCGEQLFQ